MTPLPLLVVKLGGGAGLSLADCAADIAAIAQERPVVVVHGVSAAMNALCEARGVPVQMLTSPDGHTSRYTDAATRDLFVEAARSVCAEVAEQLAAQAVRPVCLAGEGEPVVLQAERKAAIRAVVAGRVRIVRDDHSGSITGVDVPLLRESLAAGVPVLPPLASSPDGLLNVDGDRAAAAVAAALGAADFVILSNVRGLYQHYPDEASFVAHVGRSQLDAALKWAEGRMKRKVIGAVEALRGGVARVIIGDGRSPQPVTAALQGAGTHFD